MGAWVSTIYGVDVNSMLSRHCIATHLYSRGRGRVARVVLSGSRDGMLERVVCQHIVHEGLPRRFDRDAHILEPLKNEERKSETDDRSSEVTVLRGDDEHH